MNLDSIASMLTESADVDDKNKDGTEEQEELEEEVKEAPVEEKETEDNQNYKDPVPEDYKAEFNNQIGCKVWREKGIAQERLTLWNKF